MAITFLWLGLNGPIFFSTVTRVSNLGVAKTLYETAFSNPFPLIILYTASNALQRVQV